MTNQNETEKRVIIKLQEKQHAELKILLHYDDLTQTGFFRAITEGYINRDEMVVAYVEKYKDTHSLQSKHKRKKRQEAEKERKQTMKSHALDVSEIDQLYDLVEKEFPEL